MAARFVPYGRPAFAALATAIGEAKGGDLLAPITVAVPANYAGLSARRAIGFGAFRWQHNGRDGLINVRFMVLARVAEILGSPVLAGAGRRPLTRVLAGEAIRTALQQDPGLLRNVSFHPSTERSLARTFADLRQLSQAALDQLAQQGERAALVVRLYRDFHQRTRAYYDEDDLALAAEEAVRTGSAALKDLGHIILFLPRRLSSAEQGLVEALENRGALTALLGITGDELADGLLKAEAGSVFERAERATNGAGPPSTTLLVSAPDPEEEVSTALRMALARCAQGTPLHRIAVLYPATEPYSLIASSVFTAAGVAYNGPAARTLAQTVAGRCLIGLLGLRAQSFRRSAVMDWLTTCPVREKPGGRPAPAQRWDALSRTAGVVRGEAQWRLRLQALAGDLQTQRDELEEADEGSAGQLGRLTFEREQVGALAAFTEELFTSVQAPSATEWPARSRWARGLVERYLGTEAQLGAWPEDELRAYQTVMTVLEELGDLDRIGGAITEATFLRAVERELEAPAGRTGSFGKGIFVGRLQDAIGTVFDTVFILGMNEGLVPPREREDPLLPDSERRAAEVPPRAGRVAEERRDYLAALAAAPERVLLFSRADPRAQKSRLPSRWLLEIASELHGAPLYSADLARLPEQSWLTVVPSFEGALLAEHLPPASAREYDLRSMLMWRRAGRDPVAHYRVQQVDSLQHGLAAQRARRASQLSRWDGLVRRVPGLLDPEQALSPTALQEWAACPFRYFLSHVLRIGETAEPEEVDTISERDRGSLLHKAFERFLQEAPARGSPEQPWNEAERRRFAQIGEELCDEAERRGLTGKPLLWRLHRAQIARDLVGFLDQDEALRRDLGVTLQSSELAFGGRGEPPVSFVLPDGRRMLFRGRIDRVDLSPDRTEAVVLDYKSGRSEHYKDLEQTTIAHGKFLQLPVYAQAVLGAYSGVSVEAYYWFTSEQAQYERLGFAIDDARMAVFAGALVTVAGGIEAGIYVARPGADQQDRWENCRFCPYDRCCPTDRGAVWTRKKVAPELSDYLALAEG